MNDKEKLDLEEQTIAEHWFKTNLGLQQRIYDAYIGFRALIFSAFSLIPLTLYYFIRKSQENEPEDKNDYLEFVCIVLGFSMIEIAIYGLKKTNMIHWFNYTSKNSFSLHIALIQELSQGKFLPYAETDEEEKSLIRLTQFLSYSLDAFLKTSKWIHMVGILCSFFFFYTFYGSGIRHDIVQMIKRMLPVLYTTRLHFETYTNQFSNTRLTQEQNNQTMEQMITVLRENNFNIDDFSDFLYITNKNAFNFVLKFESLSRFEILKLLASNLIKARASKDGKNIFVVSLAIDKIESKEFKEYLQDALKKQMNLPLK